MRPLRETRTTLPAVRLAGVEPAIFGLGNRCTIRSCCKRVEFVSSARVERAHLWFGAEVPESAGEEMVPTRGVEPLPLAFEAQGPNSVGAGVLAEGVEPSNPIS